MAIWNLGSINIDLFYDVPHLPQPGETLASTRYARGLGGKGANISVAAARAAAHVCHIGAVGRDGAWAKDRLLEYGVDTRHVQSGDVATGHAVIASDLQGENNIILYSGANHSIEPTRLDGVLSEASAGDWFVCQNETNMQDHGCRLARQMGLRVAYVAAPFEVTAVSDVLPFLDLLVMNEVEASQLSAALNTKPEDLGLSDVVVTTGSDGAIWYPIGQNPKKIDPVQVRAVDTTGAGDTFAGHLIACLDRGQPFEQALKNANLAAAIMVTRKGTADVIPDLRDIEEFLGL